MFAMDVLWLKSHDDDGYFSLVGGLVLRPLSEVIPRELAKQRQSKPFFGVCKAINSHFSTSMVW